MKGRQKGESQPNQRDGGGENAGGQRDREKAGRGTDRITSNQEAAGAIAWPNGAKRKGNADQDRERRDER